MQKTFIGPHLRRLRLERGETQAQMARALGISTSYVNLLENNERSVSVPVMLRLFEVYGVDWRAIAEDDDSTQLADLRAVLQDPLFEDVRPDLPQLRAALVHSPELARGFLKLYRSYQAATDQLISVASAGQSQAEPLIAASPESAVHDFFRRNRNHFPELEAAAETFWAGSPPPLDDVYSHLKARLAKRLGLSTRLVPVQDLPDALRLFDEERREVLLSQAMDHPNRVFQLCHVAALVEQEALLEGILDRSGIQDTNGRARCRVELAN